MTVPIYSMPFMHHSHACTTVFATSEDYKDSSNAEVKKTLFFN